MNYKTEDLDNIPLGKGVRIISIHPCGLFALNKPVGTLSHPNRDGEEKFAVLKAKYDYDQEVFTDLGEDCPYDKIYLINRLDSATTGVILLCLDEEIAKLAKVQFEKHKVQKTYAAIVKGRPKIMPETWIDKIEKKRQSQKIITVSKGNEQIVKTQFKWIKKDENHLNLSLLHLMPLTGRTHQLRIQCVMRGHPIVGDKKYGDFDLNKRIKEATGSKRLFLHSMKTELKLYLDGKTRRIRFECKIPSRYDEIMNFNRETSRASTHNPLPPMPAVNKPLKKQTYSLLQEKLPFKRKSNKRTSSK